MEITIRNTTLRLVHGDITTQDVDAIVNATNSGLLGGSGVDGAIHAAGGPEILAGCKTIIEEIGSLEPGRAVITVGGNLVARWVIHTVGPRYQDGFRGEFVTLEHAYARSLALAVEKELFTIAFPSISTGSYEPAVAEQAQENMPAVAEQAQENVFPIEEAAHVAFHTFLREIVEKESPFKEIRMVLFSDEDFAAYSRVFAECRDTMMGTPET